MKASDVMTTDVVSVTPDTPVQEIARLLVRRGISAAPVVDAHGQPVGMVSEGDLIGRDETARQARKDWWLVFLAERGTPDPERLAERQAGELKARDVMSAPLITVGERTDIGEIARLLAVHHVKRVPVVRDGRIVGIVSRADLLRGLIEEEAEKPAAPKNGRLLSGVLDKLDGRFLHRAHPAAAATAPAPSASAEQRSDEADFSVDDFRHLLSDRKRRERAEREAQRQAAAERSRRTVAALIDHHISDEGWRDLLHQAHEAAERGEKQQLLLRFPNELCSDEGRAINALEPDWPSTLRGEAAEVYLRWERELKPRGFHLSAMVLEFPDGKPGDIGLFLVWGE
ncbi:CBS domain-containing protein [Tistlia consotensis]|uniref:CBS domain-containing protein n=1 Tax=Tistlia consotensis USBA 355 TaxID=560819 RepID=A0A1Y6BYZ1_9PROT|nr:CBS domain-containing protein [Tistlia consotensis]SMF35616.1 CBS domain-containing protein [Tistlia consotensis USBA 355]SNR71034.1 CBS domain-containing protein [Tistlia consotensis]